MWRHFVVELPPDVYSASGLSDVVGQLGELRIPEFPRFVEDLLCLPADGGVYVFGGESQYLGGATIGWLFHELIPQLDGTVTVKELHERLAPQAPAVLDDTLFLLQMHGMLEAGLGPGRAAGRRGTDATLDAQTAFFSRYLRVTGKRANRYEAQEALAQSTVLVTHEGSGAETAALLARGLIDLGVGRVARTTQLPSENAHPRWTLVISLGSRAEHLAIATQGIATGQPMLFCDVERLVLGPLTEPGITACPSCVNHQIGGELDRPPNVPSAVLDLWRRALVQRAIQRALSYLTKLFQTDRPAQVEQWCPDAATVVSYEHVLCLPNCETCGCQTTSRHLTLPDGHLESTALLFHRNTCLKPWDLDHPAHIQRHFDLDVVNLTQSAFRKHSGAPMVRLPDLASHATTTALQVVKGHDSSSVEGRCNASTLGAILRFSAGGRSIPVRPGRFHIRRYTASGGNLGSAEIYVLVRRAKLLPAGLYHYSILDDTLEELPCTGAVGHLPPWWDHDAPDIDLVVVSDVARVFEKYGGRGYTYCLLDAGLIAHRIQLLAEEFGVRSTLVWDFNDEPVNHLLDIEPPYMVPACIIGLGE
jgi:SagB-type dehydrogenase family enzyme